MIYDGIISKPSLDDVLSHHGILGQKWGKKNGPPYPLDSKVSTGKRLKNSESSTKNSSRSSSTNQAIERKVKNARKTGKYDMDFLERNLDQDQRTGKLLEGKALDDAYRKYLKEASKSSKTEKDKSVDKSIALNNISALFPEIGLPVAAATEIKVAMMNKKLSKKPKEPKTGLSIKTKEYTPEQDLKIVNPGRNNIYNEGYHSNCASCTMTYELRRRGYDVIANKNTSGIKSNEYSKYFNIKPAKTIGNRETSGGSGGLMKWQNETRKEHKEYAKSVINDLNKLPKGTRGNLSVLWGFGGGHSMFFEVGNSGVIVRDAQINKSYTNDRQLTKLFSNIVETSYFRLDNAKLKPKYIKEVCH